ncbi:unnamed protein product, partial [Prorocentrum cordatum]
TALPPKPTNLPLAPLRGPRAGRASHGAVLPVIECSGKVCEHLSRQRLSEEITTEPEETEADKAKRELAERVLLSAQDASMQAARRAAEREGPLDPEYIYDEAFKAAEAAIEGVMTDETLALGEKAVSLSATSAGTKTVNLLASQAAVNSATVVLNQVAASGASDVVVTSATQAALGGVVGTVTLTSIGPAGFASAIGSIAGKHVADYSGGDEELGSLVGSVGAGALAGAFAGSAFGPPGTLAGFAAGATLGTAQYYTARLIQKAVDRTWDCVEEKVKAAREEREKAKAAAAPESA